MTNVISLFDQPTVQTTDYKGDTHNIVPVLSKDISVDGKVLPGKKALMVDGNCVNIVSDRYEVHQPLQVYRQFEKVSKEFGLEINKTLFNPNNGGLLISAKYGSEVIVGDQHDINLTFYTSHCGKYKTFLTMDLLRIACMNQVPALYRGKERHIFAEKHYKNALDITLLGELLADLPEALNNHIEMMANLRDTKMTKQDFVEFARNHWNLSKEQKQYESKMEKILSAYNSAPGQAHLEDSAYKAYNAVTYLNTHQVRNTAMRNETVMVKNTQDSLKAMHELMVA